jgi:hypothetical protein
MTTQSLTLYRTRPDEQPVPEVTDPVMVELDQLMESTKCACSASDDNPF